MANGQDQVFNGLLAWWDTALAEPDTFHTLRLTARVGDRVVGESRARLVHLDAKLRPGWPVHLPATGLYPTNDWRHFTVADLDGDGLQEILRVQPGSPPGTPAQLLVFGPDGQVRWSRDLAPGEPASDLPVVGDVDGDGRLEIFVDAGEARLLYGFRHDGQPLGGAWPVPLPAPAPGKILADLNRNGRLELIGLANGIDQAPRLFVLDADGTLLASWHADTCWASAGWPRRFPAVGNFDDDRDLEIVAPLGCSQLALFDLQNTNHPVWIRDVSGQLLASPVVGDLNGNGRDEVLVGVEDPFAVSGRGVAGGLYAFDGYGNLLPRLARSRRVVLPHPLALADVDGDGDLRDRGDRTAEEPPPPAASRRLQRAGLARPDTAPARAEDRPGTGRRGRRWLPRRRRSRAGHPAQCPVHGRLSNHRPGPRLAPGWSTTPPPPPSRCARPRARIRRRLLPVQARPGRRHRP
ncbi:MAG: VCBS repeat-containing protein [Verrucomicrobia bacterium]|nr:VCBS repeat-containing protein [Verrucomicrobiota bacterium]